MMELQTIKTPALILDLERVRANAERMATKVKSLGANLRPHVKTHKCMEIARLQTAGHSGGITVSTLAEARAFFKNNFRDILYAVPIEPGKFVEACELAGRDERLALLTDNEDIPHQLNEKARSFGVNFDVFLKVDCGYHRVGVEPHSREALEIPGRISDSSNLRFAGILTHAGHSYHARSAEERLEIARSERDTMRSLAERLKENGLEVPCISIGSTPTMSCIDHLEGIDEARPGNYIFYDAFQATLGSCSFADCALTVLTAITHVDKTRRKIIVDAGAIALSKDGGAAEFDPACGFGRVLDLSGHDLNLHVDSLSQEHGVIFLEGEDLIRKFKVGTRLRILANHSCLTSAQHDCYYILENGRLVNRWQRYNGW